MRRIGIAAGAANPATSMRYGLDFCKLLVKLHALDQVIDPFLGIGIIFVRSVIDAEILIGIAWVLGYPLLGRAL